MEQKPLGDGDFSAVLGNILANPDMLSTIKDLAQKLKGEPAAESTSEVKESEEAAITTEQNEPKTTDALATLAPLLSGDISKLTRGDDKRACLLRALKPYLSEGRCEAIEYIIKFSALSELLKNLS